MAVQTIQAPDGYTVTYDPDALWRLWDIDQIYTGVTGQNKHVPKVRDHLINPITDQRYRVTAIDPLTLVPTYEDITNGTSNEGELLAAGVGSQPDTYRIYLDSSVTPHKLHVDARLKLHADTAAYAKIFKGTNISASGHVLGMLYDQNGTFLTHNIPLVLVAMDTHENHGIKVIPTCYTNEELVDGAMVTAVIYTAEGGEVSRRTLWVNNSSFIPDLAADTRYVSHVTLESPFMSQTDDHVIEYPINVPLQAMNMFGRVHYSDGSSILLPVDGGKFSLLGLERFVGTYPGQHVPLVLRYRLDTTEVAYGQLVSADGKHIAEPYDLVTTEQRGAFTIKLSGYPVWRSDLSEYQMRWFMSDLNRDVMFDVTPYIYFNQSSDVFNPVGYGLVQKLSVRVNLKDVSQALPSFIHTQTQTVVLMSPGTVAGANWKLAFEPNQEPLFGEALSAQVNMINQNLWRLNIRAGITNFNDWLDRVFYDSKPLYDLRKEQKAPEPTHIAMFIGAARSEVPISMWNQEFTVSLNLSSQSNLQMEFIRRTDQGDLRLGVVAVPLHSV
jgi:hypothetical protein